MCRFRSSGDGENYKHYISKFPLVYLFYFMDEQCNKYSLAGLEVRVGLLVRVLTEAFALKEKGAQEAAVLASSMGMEYLKRAADEGWQTGELIRRLAKRDVEVFSFEQISRQQLDNYNLVLFLDHAGV